MSPARYHSCNTLIISKAFSGGQNMSKRLSTAFAIGFAALLAMSAMAPSSLEAQVALDEESRVDLVLDDGTTVTLLGGAKGIGDRSSRLDYYYLPTGLRLSRTPDGKPQFLLMNYRTEEGDVSGGVLHFLMEWGLTQDQLKEAQDQLTNLCGSGSRGAGGPANAGRGGNSPFARIFGLRAQSGGSVSCGTIRGAARVTTDGDGETFHVISATLTSDGMTRSLVSSGKAPVLPGNRIAVAADMTANGAQLLAAPFERDMPIGDLSLELDLAFTSRVPAGEGRIVMNWDRLFQDTARLEREWNKRAARVDTVFVSECGPIKRFFKPRKCRGVEVQEVQKKYASDVEMQEFYSFLNEEEIIELDFRENVADERLDAVREAFFQYVRSHFAEPISAEEMGRLRSSDGTVAEELEIDQGRKRYYRSKTTVATDSAHKKQEFRLNYHLAYARPFTVVQNIKSWYDDVAANYPETMADVYLNDPFFQNQTVRFRLDFDAPQDLFSAPGNDASRRAAAINYVTVKIRKERPEAGDFTDAAVIDETYIAENGLFVEFVFGEDQSGDDSFEYMTQWSYGGGHLYPRAEQWQRASSPAVTLTPPVTTRTIEVEGDLGDMEASDISRITVQILYRKFGEAFVENIPVSPAQGQPLMSRTIFLDKDQNGYVYRLIVYRKTGDRIATDWSAKVNGNYVYAAVPTDLLQDPDLLEQAEDAARDVAGQALESAKDEVLERFRNVLEGG